MKNMIIFILSIIAITGCTKCSKTGFLPTGTETTKHNYLLEQFNNDISNMGYSPIDFSKTKIFESEDIIQKYNADGFCLKQQKQNSGSANLYFSKRFKTMTKMQQRFVFYHEIGHCFYGLGHKKHTLMTDALGTLNFNEESLLRYLKEMIEESERR